MASSEYDVSPEMLKLYQQKQKIRDEAKTYYRRIITNPHRPICDGVPFDPVLYRYSAMSAYQLEHFKPNKKNIIVLFTYFIIPVFGMATTLYYLKTNEEKEIRSGLVAYKDRLWKMNQ